MAGLVSYGGDPRVVASRVEIERVSANIGVASHKALTQLFDLFSNPLHRAQFNLHVPELEYRLGKMRVALANAADSYFTTEARVAMRIDEVAHVVRDHPWLIKLIPVAIRDQLATAAVAVTGLSLFAPGNSGAMATRALAGSIDLSGSASLALLNDKKVVIQNTRTVQGGTPVRNLGEVTSRLSQTQAAVSEIRVERYLTAEGREAFLLYLPGTQSGKDNPFDLTSDALLATEPGKAELTHAVKLALAEAGVTRSSHLVLAGYSLGGILASSIAADPNYNVTGFLSLGSPIAGAQIPNGVSVVALQHSNDPIPTLTGETNPLAENWVTASREVELKAGEFALEAHELGEYQESARLADQSKDAGLTRVRENLLADLKGAKLIETKSFELRR